jgi:heme oxygenase (biliverdin-IX-beta and delta-forming)
MRGPLLSALKSATEASHRGVEALLPGDLSRTSRSDYTAYLTRMAGFQLPLEALVHDGHDWAAFGLPDAASRRRAPLLLADLAELGVELGDIRLASRLPAVADFARALGALYVLEGSTLGGQFLVKQLARNVERLPASFFSGAGANTGALWSTFCGFAEEKVGLVDDGIALACEGALQTFDALAGWLSEADTIPERIRRVRVS